MTASDDVELDLLEQCRAGDNSSFRALFAFWGDPALRLASTFTADEGRARAAVAEAFIICWRDLPSLHSDTPFRPYLLNLVARAALARGSAGGTGKLERCLDLLHPDARLTAVLKEQAGLSVRDIARTQQAAMPPTMLQLRRAMRSLERCLGHKPGDALRTAISDRHLERRFFDNVLASALDDAW